MDFTDVERFIKLNFPNIPVRINDIPVWHLRFSFGNREYIITKERCNNKRVWLVAWNKYPILCEDDDVLKGLLLDILEATENGYI